MDRIDVHYFYERIPLVIVVRCQGGSYRVNLHESIFHFNSAIGWAMGLHRQDVEREAVVIRFGRVRLERHSVSGQFEGFILTRQK